MKRDAEELWTTTIPPSFIAELAVGDCCDVLPAEGICDVDIVFADPPYFLSGSGTTCSGGKRASVQKGDWDLLMPMDEHIVFTERWIKAVANAMTAEASLWVSGTHHNIFIIGYCLKKMGWRILNSISWEKPNPPPNLGRRCFTHSTETILWATQGKVSHSFNYDVMRRQNDGRQMKDVWRIAAPRKDEKIHGRHPTQKPIDLLKRIIAASTPPGHCRILDPFCGSGTTGVAAASLRHMCSTMEFFGVDKNIEYIKLSHRRIGDFLK